MRGEQKSEPVWDREQLLGRLPPLPETDLFPAICHQVERVGRKVIVLDDDPTGTQTVHGVPVVTRWSVEDLLGELQEPSPVSYVLTNSRSLEPDRTVALHREIAENLAEAARLSGRDFALISRSDSTLRGHFPAELETLAVHLGQTFDAWVVCPFFDEGGRLTIDDVHYVAEGQRLVPAAQTPFAQDPVFGYRSSNLRQWVVEKSQGRIAGERIRSLSIQRLRQGDTDGVCREVMAAPRGTVWIINAAHRRDLECAVAALLEAERKGMRFLYRTAASLVAVRGGIPPRPLLKPQELASPGGRGWLVVVGSFVPKSTRQLEQLLEARRPKAFGVAVEKLVPGNAEGLIAQLARQVDQVLAEDQPAVVFTSRQVVGGDRHRLLAVGRRISAALTDLVRRLSVRPRALVGKGGITSSDLATEACGVVRATVLGQIIPGVPVWRCGPESRFPGMPLVVFPGNVGDATALVEVLDRLRGAAG